MSTLSMSGIGTTGKASFFLTAQIAAAVATLGNQILIARLLGPELRGAYALCFVSATLLYYIFIQGVEFRIRHLFLNARMAMAQSISALAVFCVIAIILSAVSFEVIRFAGFWPSDLQDMPFGTCVGMISLVGSQALFVQWNVCTTISGKLITAGMFYTGLECAKFIFLYATAQNELSIDLAIAAQLLAVFIFLGCYFIIDEFNFDFTRGQEDVRFWSLYREGLKAGFYSLSNIGNIHLVTLALGFYASSAQVGSFSLAQAMVSRMQLLPDALNRVIVPRLSKLQPDQEKQRLVVMSCAGIFLVSSVICIIIYYFAESVIPYIFGSDFPQLVELTVILAFAYLLRCTFKPIEGYLVENVGLGDYLSVTNLISTIVCVIIIIIFGCEYDAFAAAGATACGIFVVSIMLIRKWILLRFTPS